MSFIIKLTIYDVLNISLFKIFEKFLDILI